MLYEMIAGRRPFEGETMSDVIVAILERKPQPLAEIAPETRRDSRPSSIARSPKTAPRVIKASPIFVRTCGAKSGASISLRDLKTR